MSSRNNGQTVFLISCRSTHHYFLDNCADSSIWWHFKLYWTLIHVCNKMKRIVLGSSLPDDKLIKLHNSLCSQMEDIGLAWFGVAWDVGLKLPSLSAWPWTAKIASLLFFSVVLLCDPSHQILLKARPSCSPSTIRTLKSWHFLPVFHASSPKMDIALGNSKLSLRQMISVLFGK